MKLVTIDWVIIGAYFVLSLVIGLYYARGWAGIAERAEAK